MIESLTLTPKERDNALSTIEAMQHPRQLGMYADWWIKWLKRSVALDALYSIDNGETARKALEVEG